MLLGQSKRKPVGNIEIEFRPEDNTRYLDNRPSYSKLIVKAMKIKKLYKGKQQMAENWIETISGQDKEWIPEEETCLGKLIPHSQFKKSNPIF